MLGLSMLGLSMLGLSMAALCTSMPLLRLALFRIAMPLLRFAWLIDAFPLLGLSMLFLCLAYRCFSPVWPFIALPFVAMRCFATPRPAFAVLINASISLPPLIRSATHS
jgi:hypothetical protein